MVFSLFYITWYVINIQLHYWAFLMSVHKLSITSSHRVLHTHNYSLRQCRTWESIIIDGQIALCLESSCYADFLAIKLNDGTPLIETNKNKQTKKHLVSFSVMLGIIHAGTIGEMVSYIDGFLYNL